MPYFYVQCRSTRRRGWLGGAQGLSASGGEGYLRLQGNEVRPISRLRSFAEGTLIGALFAQAGCLDSGTACLHNVGFRAARRWQLTTPTQPLTGVGGRSASERRQGTTDRDGRKPVPEGCPGTPVG
jgi:hypothetical protein